MAQMMAVKEMVKLDPQQLLAVALERGAGVETLERLVALAKDLHAVQAREAWNQGMAEFQRRCPAIKKTNTAQIATQRGGFYSYKYAALDEILEIIRPLLGELGFSVYWEHTKVEPQKVSVSCKIAHVLGHSESSGEVSMPIADSSDRSGGNPAQKVGSALTYARRYSLLSVTGLAPEDDDDGRATHPPRQRETESPARHEEGSRPPSDPGVESAAEAPAGDDPHVLAVEEWKQELSQVESVEKLASMWKTLTKPNTWHHFSGDEQTDLASTKDKRKVELQKLSGQLV